MATRPPGTALQVGPALWRLQLRPVPLPGGQGRFFNQCIQKKGLTDFTDGTLVAVVGGCEGSAVLAVVDLPTRVVQNAHVQWYSLCNSGLFVAIQKELKSKKSDFYLEN